MSPPRREPEGREKLSSAIQARSTEPAKQFLCSMRRHRQSCGKSQQKQADVHKNSSFSPIRPGAFDFVNTLDRNPPVWSLGHARPLDVRRLVVFYSLHMPFHSQ